MIGVLYYIAYLFCGIVITAILLNDYKRHQIIIVGLSVGTLLCAWMPAAVSLIFGTFNELTNIIAVVVTIAGSLIPAYMINRKKPFIGKCMRNSDDSEETVMLLVTLPFMILIAVLFWGHVLVTKNGGYYGGQSTYGDLSMHLGMITSIARQGVFPPEYSILPGTRLSYPFPRKLAFGIALYVWHTLALVCDTAFACDGIFMLCGIFHTGQKNIGQQ